MGVIIFCFIFVALCDIIYIDMNLLGWEYYETKENAKKVVKVSPPHSS